MARCPEEFIQPWVAKAAESSSPSAVFQAMISPAPYQRIPASAMRSKTSVPPDCVWLKLPDRAMYSARSRARAAIRESQMSGTSPAFARRWFVSVRAAFSALEIAAAEVSVSAASVAGTTLASSMRARPMGTRGRMKDRMARWSTGAGGAVTDHPSQPIRADGPLPCTTQMT
jgi:hypothetical protein